MKGYTVLITTNIDQYRTKNCFPEDLPVIPRLGECVRVKPSHESFYVGQGLPAILEVTSIEYRETNVVVHVQYRKIDIDRHILTGTYDKLYK